LLLRDIDADCIVQRRRDERTDDVTNYADFIASKKRAVMDCGIHATSLNRDLFKWQADIVRWALRKGRTAIFADCGMGKTFMQLEWASQVPGDVILLTPLAVGRQTEAEAVRFGIDAKVSTDGKRAAKVTIINYEKLHMVDASQFSGVVLDESSILKSMDGNTKNLLISMFSRTRFRLACTATPAPNDHMELGNHAAFLGVITMAEMLATYFCHDGGETSVWRLKGHAVDDFWAWVASWAVMIRRPSDIGFSDDGFELPPLRIHVHEVKANIVREGELFGMPVLAIDEQRKARRATLAARVERAADIANSTDDPVLVWCELNDESDALETAIHGAVSVSGSDTDEAKSTRMMDFARGDVRALVTKPKIAGFGMNWQTCNTMVFVGLSHSYEQFYQAVRRCWRFGQQSAVDVHIITSDAERAVLDNIQDKQSKADEMVGQMVAKMQKTMSAELREASGTRTEAYAERTVTGDGWTMHHGDCVEVVSKMDSDSVGFSVFSPPFASLYTYSASDRDMGNCRTHSEFYEHFRFLVAELLRVTMPGRLCSFHCMNLPTSKERDGYIGITDFRGELIRIFRDAGWIYHSEVTIWKDPVTAMQRTKALGLLHKQIKKDSCMSRQGIADYLVTMRKPGINPDPVTHTGTGGDMPVDMWQQYASPVWMDINPSDTLQYMSAREHDDERHICPLQLQVIDRALTLWSKPGDLVLSPFGGIGSEGHVALKAGRRFVGVELKRSYFEQACRNLNAATSQMGLFGMMGIE
jgi:DNA modification methylase/superfamily II DNA or RNA helicase